MLTIIVLSISVIINILFWVAYEASMFNTIFLISVITINTFLVSVVISLIYRCESLRGQSVRDSMTQIYNWKYIKDSITTEIERFKRSNKKFGVIYFDIDDFKVLNTIYGHYAGDQVLLEVVEVVKSLIRPYDLFGRMGGEEFCVILPEIDQKDIMMIAERIRSKIEAIRLNRKVLVTISTGVTLVKEDDSYFSLYNRVDERMTEAKNSGKNRVIFGA